MNTYLKTYGMDSIPCTVFVKFTVYKSLLSSANDSTALLVCIHGGGGAGVEDDNCHHRGPNTNEGGRGIEQRKKRFEICLNRMDSICTRRGRGNFYDNIEC